MKNFIKRHKQSCEDKVLFQQVEYSYEDLLEIQKSAVPELEMMTNVHEHYIDVVSNRVNIGVDASYNAKITT